MLVHLNRADVPWPSSSSGARSQSRRCANGWRRSARCEKRGRFPDRQAENHRQMTAIPMLLWHTPIGPLDIHLLGTWALLIAAVLTLWSMVYYLRMAWPEISARSR
jgi:hypothetical protein